MEKICERCGKTFNTKNKHSKYCSSQCKTIIKECVFCHKSYETERPEQKYCSEECRNKGLGINKEFKRKRSIYMKSKWQDNDYKESQKKERKNRYLDEEYKAKISARLREVHKDPEYKNKMSIIMKELWQNEEYRTKVILAIKKGTNTKECVERHKKIAAEFWTIENRNRYSEQIKEKWKDEEYRSKQINERVQRWSDEVYRKNHSDTMTEKWKDEEYASKHFNASTKYKDFTLPSGRIVRLQGYEPQILEQLLYDYKETDICIGIKEIHNEIGKICYKENNKEHRYYPDFFIKSTNTIIEVKSKWTYEKWKNRNELKKLACETMGYNFEFRIL